MVMIRPIIRYIPMGDVNTTVDATKLPPTKTAPYGFYWLLDVPNNGAAAMADVRANLNNPKVDGFRLRVAWSDIQPSVIGFGTPQMPTAYNWKIIDDIKQLVSANNRATGRQQRISLSVSAGIVCPRWVFDDNATVYEFNVDPSVSLKGDLAGPGPYSMPLPWDVVFQNKWRTFVNAFGNRYDNDPLVAYVACTGFMELTVLNFIVNTDASVYVTDAFIASTGSFTQVDSATAQFVTRTGGGGGAGILGKVISDGTVNLLDNSRVVGVADGAPADPTDTRVYLDKTPIFSANNVTVLVEEWIANKGDNYKVNVLAQTAQNGPGKWLAYADDPVGYASSAAFLDGSKAIADMFFTAFPNTPVLLSAPTQVFPSSNTFAAATGKNIRQYIENHLPHGGDLFTNLQARRPPYSPRVTVPFTSVKQAIHPSNQTSQLYANGEPVPPFPGQPFQCMDLIEAGYTLGAIALELYKFDLTDSSVDATVRAERRKFVPANIP